MAQLTSLIHRKVPSHESEVEDSDFRANIDDWDVAQIQGESHDESEDEGRDISRNMSENVSRESSQQATPSSVDSRIKTRQALQRLRSPSGTPRSGTREEIKAELLNTLRAELNDVVKNAIVEAMRSPEEKAKRSHARSLSSSQTSPTSASVVTSPKYNVESTISAATTAALAAVEGISTNDPFLASILRPALEAAVRSTVAECLATSAANSPTNNEDVPSPLSTPASSLHRPSMSPDPFAMLEKTHGIQVANAAREAARKNRLTDVSETKSIHSGTGGDTGHLVVVLPESVDGSPPDLSQAMIMNSDGTPAPPHMVELARRALTSKSPSPPTSSSSTPQEVSKHHHEHQFSNTSHFVAPVSAQLTRSQNMAGGVQQDGGNGNGNNYQNPLLRSAPAAVGRRSLLDEEVELLREGEGDQVGVDIGAQSLERRLFEMRGGASDVATLGSHDDDEDDDGDNGYMDKSPSPIIHRNFKQQQHSNSSKQKSVNTKNAAAAAAAGRALHLIEQAERRAMEEEATALVNELRLAEHGYRPQQQQHQGYATRTPMNGVRSSSELTFGVSPLTSPGNSMEYRSQLGGGMHCYSPSPNGMIQKKGHLGVMSISTQEFKEQGWAGLNPTQHPWGRQYSTANTAYMGVGVDTPVSDQKQGHDSTNQEATSPLSPDSSTPYREQMSDGVRESQEALQEVQRALNGLSPLRGSPQQAQQQLQYQQAQQQAQQQQQQYTAPPPPPPPQQKANEVERAPVTAPLDPSALSQMKPAIALATTFLNLRQNVMQFRYALGMYTYCLLVGLS